MARERLPSYDLEHFLRAFRFDRETEKLLRRCARAIGFDGQTTCPAQVQTRPRRVLRVASASGSLTFSA